MNDDNSDFDGGLQQVQDLLVDDLLGRLANLEPWLRLHMLKRIAATLDDVNRSTVDEMRDQCFTWEQIGKMLGVSRQAAHEKYGYH